MRDPTLRIILFIILGTLVLSMMSYFMSPKDPKEKQMEDCTYSELSQRNSDNYIKCYKLIYREGK